jgi:hypothetical protein
MSSVEKLEAESIVEIYNGPPINPFSLPGAYDLHDSVGFAYTMIGEPTINNHPQEPSNMQSIIDGVYNMHYKENPLSQLIQPSRNVINDRIKKYLSDNLGDLWNIDADPFSRIVASYIGIPVWTYYLDWMYYWTKQKRNIKSLDLILEYAFKKNEITLLKLPSHIAVEQDDWKITPIIEADKHQMDPANFTKKEPLLIIALRHSALRMGQKIMRRVGPNLVDIDSVPKIFYSSSFSQSKVLFPQVKHEQAAQGIWNYSSLDELVICNGKIRPKIGMKYDPGTYEPNLEDFAYCQLCDRETFICSICEFRDLLFCHIHSGMAHSETIKCRALALPATPALHLCKKCGEKIKPKFTTNDSYRKRPT